MIRQEVIDYLLNLNFKETGVGIYSKDYDNKFKLEYRLSRVMVSVYYITFNKTTRRMKARYKHIQLQKDGSLSGFTVLN